MNGIFFPSIKDKQIRADDCSVCTCFNETSVCAKQTCPILDCLSDFQVIEPGNCCPSCSGPSQEFATSTCTYKGTTYQVSITNFGVLYAFNELYIKKFMISQY